MRRVSYEHFGEPADVLRVEDAPDLQPPGAHEVLIRVATSPVHPGDLAGIRGRYDGGKPAGPTVPGFEGVGTVQALGPGGVVESGLKVGQRVAFFPVQGAWAEQVVTPVQFAIPVPDAVSDAVASQLMINPITAAMLLREAENAALTVDNGVLLLTAAGSGVARLLAAMATARGYATISVVRSAEGAARLRPVSDGPVVSSDDTDWVAKVRDAAEGRQIRVACDPIGGAMAASLAGLLADGGTLLAYGGLAANEPMGLDSMDVTSRGLSVRGVTIGRWLLNTTLQVRADDISAALQLAQERPDLFAASATYDLGRIADAVKEAERSGKTGTVLLTSSAS
ncbi:zinc-binding dehydrogenase [Streptomyces sp. NPDC005345]|uniref:alcohol dehydrogenase catalytic domain-containing protein n=1 Tax=Streptomyces sp. NPDC005345 TaxID=3156877 RepID=UPI0033ABA17D